MAQHESNCAIVPAVIWGVIYVASAFLLSQLPYFTWWIEVAFQASLLLSGVWITVLVFQHRCSLFVRAVVLVSVFIFYALYILTLLALGVLGSGYFEVITLLSSMFLLVWVSAIILASRWRKQSLPNKHNSTPSRGYQHPDM